MTTPLPQYIFRGHTAQVNALRFFRKNTALLSCDGDGYIFVWDIRTRRTIHRWKGHDDSVVAIEPLGDFKIISHGRDNQIHLWDLEDTNSLAERRPSATIPANTLSFCKFSFCTKDSNKTDFSSDIFLATPSLGNPSLISIYSFPSSPIPIYHNIGFGSQSLFPDPTPDGGTLMTFQLFRPSWNLENIYLLTGYESGDVILYKIGENTEIIGHIKAHSEPVLSVVVDPTACFAFSTAADKTLHKYALSSETGLTSSVTQKVKSPGLSQIAVRSDGRIVATAGWDGRLRIFSSKSLKPLAVLTYHHESCYAVEFAEFEKEGDGNLIVGGGKDERISLWKIY